MNKISAAVLATALVATAASAGGPSVVAVESEPVAVVAEAGSSLDAGIAVPLLLLIILAFALS